MARDGHEITINQSSIILPKLCCACGTRPPTGTINIQAVAHRVRRTMAMPYCGECMATRKKTLALRFVLVFGLALVAAAISALGVVVPSLPIAVLIAVPTVVALALGLGGPNVVRRTLLPTPAVRMLGFAGNSTTFLCAEATFAERFAAGNGAAVRKRSWSDGFVTLSAIVTVIVGGAVAAYVGLSSNPPVHFDNATKKPVKIWLDGKPLLSVEPRTGTGVRPDLRIPYGAHVLGWSKPGDDEPRDTAEVTVEWGRDHLFNPAQAGCYFLQATAYGSASTSGLEHGPLPIRPFYVFKSVDNWFQGNPSTVSTKASGETRVALLPWASCMELTNRGCPLSARKKAVACSREAWRGGDDAGMKSCMARALAACGGDE
jgi:hypothetical protein